MHKIKTEVAIIGNGCASVFAANKLANQGINIVLINPCPKLEYSDLQPYHGLGLWDAAYRSESKRSLPEMYDQLAARLQEVFPSTIENSGLNRVEHWALLSGAPRHRKYTEVLEREFFKLERKQWSSGQFRLVNPEHVHARFQKFALDANHITQLGGAVIQNYALQWNPIQIGFYLSQFLPTYRYFSDAIIRGHYGRKIKIETKERKEISLVCEKAVLIFLTGSILPYVKVFLSSEPWLQGLRKRRKEQHFIWFEQKKEESEQSDSIWIEIGGSTYGWSTNKPKFMTWSTSKGPDGFHHYLEEAFRFQIKQTSDLRVTRVDRFFRLEWEWKTPQWKSSSHNIFWATAFEGDLWNTTELLWNLPIQ